MADTEHPQGAAGNEPLFDVLGRVSAELRDIAELIERLEPMLSSGFNSVLQSPEQLRLMQGIDLAVQKARGLAGFLDEVGGQLEIDQIVDISRALNLITLEDMKRRLKAGVHDEPSTDHYRKASGEADFF